MSAKSVKKIEEVKAVAIVPTVKKDLILEGDPEAQLAFAMKAANALMKVAKPINIQGKEYLPFGSWQILGRFFGSTVGVEWTKKIEETGRLMGYEARAVVYRSGEIISSAEASCMKTERNWSSRDEYAVKSMAQTRACAKALRNAFGWVAEMGGYAATPFEEMDGIVPDRPKMVSYETKRIVPASDDEAGGAVIQDDKQFLEKEEILEVQKARIKELLLDLGHKPTTVGGASDVVFDLTGLALKPQFYEEIIRKLSGLSPIEKLGTIT